MKKMNETFLVTGATGFLGSHLTHELINRGYNVIALKRCTSNLWRLEDISKNNKLKIIDVDNLEDIFANNSIDCIIHTVCSYGRNNETLADIVQTNIVFGLKLLDLAKKNKVKCFFNTDTLLQRDLNNYSLSKKQFVEWLKKNHGEIQVFNMKVEHMYGIKDDSTKFVNWLIEQLNNNVREIELTSGIQKRDFIYVLDVVNAYLTVYEHRLGFDKFSEFDVGTGVQLTVKEFVKEIFTAVKEYKPELSTFLNFGARKYRPGECMEVVENVEPLKSLGWKPKNDYKYNIRLLLEDI